ncbi:MAG: hypothetical protein SOT80_04135 [Candidatus Pseudoruminococcus sp.]|nr:hypothetical protein [Ruminococcus sp.]MDY2782577.1 hypothetical protein [Candidatus Pseudoruminococcus sp.]
MKSKKETKDKKLLETKQALNLSNKQFDKVKEKNLSIQELLLICKKIKEDIIKLLRLKPH